MAEEGEIECPHCGYTWRPNKRTPKSCPCCKRYIVVPEKLAKKRLDAVRVLIPDQTGIYLNCSTPGCKGIAQFGLKNKLLCKACMLKWTEDRPEVKQPGLGG